MSTCNTIELCEQIHELRTDAVIMEAAMRAYETMIEERDDQIAELEAQLEEAYSSSVRLGIIATN